MSNNYRTNTYKLNIPEKYANALQNILNEMEQETGNMYQFTVNCHGKLSNYDYVIGDFDDRNFKIEVYDMIPGYSELEGVYDTKDDVIKKMRELGCGDMFEETKDWKNSKGIKYTIGKCKKCHSYNEGVPRTYPNIVDRDAVCQNKACSTFLRSKWNYLQLSKYDSDIYESHGGSVSVCEHKGRYRFVK
jgi:hypothetical protein